MMIKGKGLASIVIVSLLLSITFLGCGGGGSTNNAPTPLPPTPSIQATPSSYSFGIVTPGNSPAPLKVEIMNNGSASLNVSGISLSDTNNFTLDLNGGVNPCITASPTIAPGSSCTIEVRFQPLSTASFNGILTITSNDPNTSTFNVPLSGSQEAISGLNVRINQIEISCPTGVVTAYVSVTDQGGYSVTGLTRDDFLVTETVGGYVGPPTSVPFVENTATLSAALVMDLSTSVTSVQDKVNDMQEAAAGFVDQLGADDEAEIVKFGPIIEVVQPYTSDKVLLNAAINTPWDKGAGTVLWDAAKIAVDDTAARTKDRKAVIVISDGFSYDTSIGLDDLIDYALLKNVPIFSVGLGNDINVLDLTTMADGTGGQYYEASTSDNLRTVYQQLADVLFSYQYILTYSSGLGAGATDNTTIKATLPLSTIEGNDTREITRPAICP